MGKAGILTAEDRVELLDGEVLIMSPIGERHAACVNWLTAAFYNSGGLSGRAFVSVQNPLALSERSEPQPDLMLLVDREDGYATGHPGPQDVLLVVEVADSTLDYDRNTKVALYGAAGIREVWLIDLERHRIESYTEPGPAGYRLTRRFARGQSLAPAALPDLTLEVARIIPGTPRPRG